MTRRLSKDERKYVDALWRRTRRATLNMINAMNKWDRLSDEINDWLDRSNRHEFLDRAGARGDSIPLQDAYASWQFWHGTVMALNAALQAETLAPQLLGLDDERYVRPEPPPRDQST